MAAIIDFSFINQIKNKFGNLNNQQKNDYSDLDTTDYLTTIYKTLNINYPKFYKMDNLSKTGFLLSEFIVSNHPELQNRKDISVVAFNRISSLETDINYQKTITDSENFFPAPSLFVYTLPNIVTGEICIRNKFFGESTFYVIEKFNAEEIFNLTNDLFYKTETNYVLSSWLNCKDFKPQATMFLVSRNNVDSKLDFSPENISKICQTNFLID